MTTARLTVPDPAPDEHTSPVRTFSFDPWDSLPALETRTEPHENRRAVCLFERSLAAIGLAVSSPVFLLVALAVKLDSPRGPVLFKQARVGLDRRKAEPEGDVTPYVGEDRRRERGVGSVFHVYKFRTMVPDAEKASGPVWATENDPRVTRVGRVLRYLRLDEFPQLLNVVRGEMRLIGPGPERPYFVEKLSTEIPSYLRRLKVPPGITGLAQVERNYDETVDDVRTKIRYDLYYAQNRSLVLDTKILIKTIDVVFRGRGAR